MHDVTFIHLFDWYDGPVTGVVKAQWLPGPHLCTLLAYDPDRRLRAFALLPLSEPALEGLRAGLDADWEALVTQLRDLWSSTEASAVLVCRTDPEDRIVSKTKVDVSRVRAQAVNDIEEAIDGTRRHWLDEGESG